MFDPKRIFKYGLRITDVQEVAMPEHAQLLSVGEQNGELVLWAITEGNPTAKRHIAIRGTGNQFVGHPGHFIGTVQMSHGAVWHVFDLGQVTT